MPAAVYLLHFDEPLQSRSGKRVKRARHYIGASRKLKARLAAHARGYTGSRLMAVLREQGIGFRVAAAWEWPGSQAGQAFRFERHLKARKRAADWCPCCATTTYDPLATWDGPTPVQKRVSYLQRAVATAAPAPKPLTEVQLLRRRLRNADEYGSLGLDAMARLDEQLREAIEAEERQRAQDAEADGRAARCVRGCVPDA
jgi:predicted GIY-YIG superfamily endonuclease